MSFALRLVVFVLLVAAILLGFYALACFVPDLVIPLVLSVNLGAMLFVLLEQGRRDAD